MSLTTKKANSILKAVERHLSFSFIRSISVSLNYGGCGILAEELYYLFEKLGLSPKIMVITTSPASCKDNLTSNGNNAPKRFFYHIMIEANGKLVDTDGVYKSLSQTYEYKNMDAVEGMGIELLRLWNADPVGWNSAFDRDLIPVIKERFNEISKILFEQYLEVSN
jgi:hypothetical protein